MLLNWKKENLVLQRSDDYFILTVSYNNFLMVNLIIIFVCINNI